MSEFTKIIEADLDYISQANLPWRELEGKNILVTGANGMIGSYLVEVLLYLNDHLFKDKLTVLALARNREKINKRFAHRLNDEHLKIIIQDVNADVKVDRKIDYIIHAASQASPVFYSKDPVGTLLPNVEGTKKLLDLAIKNQVSGFLFVSSSEIYGELRADQLPVAENQFGVIDPTNIRSCYSESKRMGETMCVSWLHQYGVPIKIVRPFHVYGPGIGLSDGRVFADFISDIVNRRDIIMKSDGQAQRSFCYLADAILGFYTVLLMGKVGEAYNIGNDKAVIKIVDLAERLVGLFPELQLQVVKKIEANNNGYIKSMVVNLLPNITKISKLGWSPKYSIEEGFKRSIQSYL